MFALIKRILVVALVVTLAAGCADTTDILPTPQIGEQTYESMGKATYFPVQLDYALDNPLEIIEVKSDRNYHWTYFQISGLKDKVVETRINEEIKALYEQMLPYVTGETLPPYRGINAAVHENMVFSDTYLSLTLQFNCNNVLSVYARASGGYKSLPHEQVYFSAVETLNFDLNSGETFLVADVFVNDIDALELINAFIADEIRSSSMEADMGWYRSFSVVSPFKGIRHDQKFYLDNYGLNIVLDYNNPEFDLGFNEGIITIPFKPDYGKIAITERFCDKDDYIYVRDIVGKRFFSTFFPREATSKTREVNGIEWNVVFSCPEEIYSMVNAIAESRWQRDKSKVVSLSGIHVTHVEQSFHASYMGDFINLSCSIHVPAAEQYYWEEEYIVCTPEGKVLELGDVFAPGFDYISIIEPALARAVKEQGVSDTDALMEKLTFKLGTDRISFFAMARNNYPVFFDIPYAVVGCDNLTIFP